VFHYGGPGGCVGWKHKFSLMCLFNKS
jgi:hypothetical protein